MQGNYYIQAAECLKVLAHPQRIKIIALLRAGPLTVGEIAKELETQSHMASEHLRLMQRCQFLGSTREGRKIYYEIAEPHLLELLACMEKKFGKESNGKYQRPRI